MAFKYLSALTVFFLALNVSAQMPEAVVADPQSAPSQNAPQPQPATPPPSVAPVQANPAAPTSAFFYYCDKVKAYYPQVQQCAEGWIAVPAGAAAPIPPPPAARPWPVHHFLAGGDEIIHNQRSAATFEFFGRALLYSLNYDYLVGDHLALGLGVSSWQSDYWWSTVTSTVTVVPVYANIYFSNNLGRGFLSAGVDWVSVTNPNSGQTNNVFNSSGAVPTVGGGYEIHSPSGYLLRFGGFLLIGKSTTEISPSVSVGYGF